MKNRYLKRAHISERQFRRVLKYFTQDFNATQVSELVGVSRVTVNRLYNKFRQRIFKLSQRTGWLNGEVEIDEAYFGGRRIRGKRGRGALGKVPVVGILEREGKVYTQVLKDCTRKELMPVIKRRVLPYSVVYTDGWRSYDGLILSGYRHYRICHHQDEFVQGKNHINGIESFWSFTKRRLRKLNGIRKDKFVLHLKESEFRWNHRGGKWNLARKINGNSPQSLKDLQNFPTGASSGSRTRIATLSRKMR